MKVNLNVVNKYHLLAMFKGTGKVIGEQQKGNRTKGISVRYSSNRVRSI